MNALAPQLSLAAGLLLSLAAGMTGRLPASFYRALAAAAVLAACVLSALGAPSTYGPLIRLDGLSLCWQPLVCAGALPFVLSLAGDEVPAALALGSLLGMTLLAASANLLMLFIGLEFMSLPAYLLVGRGGGKSGAAQEASIKYFFAGGVAASLFLLGLAVYYSATHTLALVASVGPTAEAGIALMGAAALFKVGAVPLHFWLPDAYEASSPELAGFMSTSLKSAGFLLLMRLAALAPSSAFAGALPAFGALTAIVGALGALYQSGLQRLLAYSSIAHAGFLILGVGAWAAQGAAPADAVPLFFYLAAYLFMSNGSFFFLKASGATTRADLKGYAAAEPVKAALFAILLLSLGGVPPTAGFLAKLLVFWAAIKAGFYAPAVAAGMAALISLVYYLGIVRDMYFDAPEKGKVLEAKSCSTVLWACALPAAVLGLAPWLASALSGVLAR